MTEDDKSTEVLVDAINSLIPKRLNDGICWHYTDMAGLIGILSSDCLWASSAKTLSDTSEMSFGLEMLKEAWADFENDNSLSHEFREYLRNLLYSPFIEEHKYKLFILSASQVDDLLSQWGRFAGLGGFSIGLDMSLQMRTSGTDLTQNFELRQDDLLIPGWHTVAYPISHSDPVINDLRNALQKFFNATTAWKESDRVLVGRIGVVTSSAKLKHLGFEEESEVRYIAGRSKSVNQKYRTGTSGTKGYIELKGIKADAETGTTIGKLPIVEIKCGPGFSTEDQPLIEDLLIAYGYDNVKVTHSRIPFIR
jgi:hypothetical protein